jgi:hypothetical protein
MKQTFPGHYRPDEKEIERMWAEGTFVFDANALLNLYRYTDATREEFIQTLEALHARVWVPYQVGVEFFQNRAQVMSTAALGYARLRTELAKTRDDLSKVLNGFRRHPGIDVDQISQELDDTFSRLQSALETQEARHPDWLTGEDPVLLRLSSVFDGRVGQKPEAAEGKKLLDKAKSRFDMSQPPGLRDKDKGGVQQYGDAVLWLEILQKASAAKSPIIFVTDDVKDDWWQRVGGKTIGPLPELRQELWDFANVPLHMYRTLPESSIEEAKEVRDELQRVTFEELNTWLESVSNKTLPEDERMSDALIDILDLHRPRPVLVSDYRGPTLRDQLLKLVDERSRLANMLLNLVPEARRSDQGRAIRDALDFVDREIIIKKRLQRDVVDDLLELPGKDRVPGADN